MKAKAVKALLKDTAISAKRKPPTAKRMLSFQMFVLLSLTCLLFPAISQSQVFRGTISGIVTDAQGNAVPHVAITATEMNTGTASGATTTDEGKYTIPFLAPGTYQVLGAASSFEQYLRKGITLDPGGSVVVDMQLKAGSANLTITVTADVPLLQVSNAAIGQTITTEQVDDVPLNGNGPMALTLLAMGVQGTAAPGFNPPFNNGGLASFSLGGVQPSGTELQFDGSPNSDYQWRLAYSPPLGTVGQVQIFAFQPDAAYGHTGGGFVNMISKNGTNSFHGSAYEFNQVSYLKANSYFGNRAGQKRPITRYNQYGVSASGPVYIPKLYDGRNRMFWLFAWEGIRDVLPATGAVTVPTAAERNGDFSALLSAGAKYQIYDPATAKAGPNGSVIRQPFPNNIIPQSRLDPIALAYLQYYPQPNSAGGIDGFNNYFTTALNPDLYDNQFGRLDVNIGAKDKLFFDFRHSGRTNVGNNFLHSIATGQNLDRINWGSLVDNVYILNSTTVIDTRANWTRFTERYSEPSAGFDPTTLGFPSYMTTSSQYKMLPAILFASCSSTVNNFINSGSSFQCLGDTNPYYIPYDSFVLFGEVTKTAGNHSLKVGIDGREYIRSLTKYGTSSGQFGFNSSFTTSSNGAGTAPLGQDLASFLLGLPTSGAYTLNAKSTSHNKYLALFAQDDWRVSRNLTLNLGLRYEQEFPLYERHNRAVNGFDTTVQNPISAAASAAYNAHPISQIPTGQFSLPGGLTFATAAHPEIYVDQSHLFSPRFGFAWTPPSYHGGTVLRGGFGLFTFPITINQVINQQGYSQVTNYIATNNNYLTAANTLSNPFSGGILQPVGASQGLATFNGSSISYFIPKTQNPYSERWNLDLQQQFGQNTMLEFAYVGNHVVRLQIPDTNLNFIPRQYLSTSPSRDFTVINTLNASVPNPMAALLPGSTLNGSTIALYQLLLPYPQYPLNGVDRQASPTGSSSYNSLNVRAERRMSNNLSLIANYAWSKQMEDITRLNDSDPKFEHRISSYDHTHHFLVAAGYRLPIGKGNLINLESKWADRLLGGWMLNTVYTYQSGPPIVWGNLIYYGGPLHYKARQTVGTSFDTTQFNTNSSQQLSYNIRTFKSTYGNLRQDGINNLDSSVLKDFAFSESIRFQLRLEAFNILNHPTFASPNVTATSSQFASVTQQFNQPRAIQLGGRVTW
jgi:hypothetical protein